MHQSKHKIYYKTHFISGTKFYMSPSSTCHQGAIIREFIINRGLYIQQVFQALFAHISTTEVKKFWKVNTPDYTQQV
jgi:hypothetical protein